MPIQRAKPIRTDIPALTATDLPTDSVLQSKFYTYSTLTTTTSNTASGGITLFTPTIVAKQANTKIRIWITVNWDHANSWNCHMSIGRDINGTSYTYGQMCDITKDNGNDQNSVMAHRSSRTYSSDHNSWWGEQDVTNSVGDNLNYIVKIYSQNSTTTYINRAENHLSNEHDARSGCRCLIEEIAG